ncbi:MAG TPA: extensin family protein [Polyangiaceae bacterium]
MTERLSRAALVACALLPSAACALITPNAAPPATKQPLPAGARAAASAAPAARLGLPSTSASADGGAPPVDSDAGTAPEAAADAAPPVELSGPFQDDPPATLLGGRAPAMRYGNLSPGACRGELRKRSIATRPPGAVTPGVATPLRIAGPLRGVSFVAPGRRSIYGVLDCRLLLVLDDLSDVLARHDVSAVLVDNFYRRRARLPGRKSRSQHAYGLAADVYGFKLRDGRELIVERDWHGQLGEPSCGPQSRIIDGTGESLALRNLVCDIAREGFFHHILTPNYNEAHENHLHLDIKRGDREGRIR